MLPISVLSLFDGISCGQVALARAGIAVQKYFASEIDQNAIKVTKARYPGTVHLGDVKTFNVDALPPIDLMFGGWPCVGHSLAGKHGGLNDPRSGLFHDLIRTKNQVKPTYFLFENVCIPPKDIKEINSLIGVSPIILNSSLVSAQSRKRMYWTNIPIPEIEDRGIKLNKWLFTNPHGNTKAEVRFYEKSPTLKSHAPIQDWKIVPEGTKVPEDYLNGKREKRGSTKSWHSIYSSYTPEDCEELQTLSRGYTDVGLSKTARYKAIGNGWTVDLIVELLKGL